MGEVAPLGDGEGRKISNFIIFSDSRGRLSLQLKGCVRTYFVGVGALDDPKSNQLLQYIGRTHDVR